MGCSSCSYENGVPTGCGDKGHCTSGSCNKMNTYDWLTATEINDPTSFKLVEVSFKKGARKEFFINPDYVDTTTGDMVVVDSGSGYDIGRITLTGELVRLQMKKKRISEDRVNLKLIRVANDRDLEKLQYVRDLEKQLLIRSRVIARNLGLDMKIGDIEYQGDGRKVTIYYTADGRVDFRELVRKYAREFKVKIEMRQIGARQESGRIGGLGSCGRELCCSTWLSDFKSVTTSAARYQNIAINQTKLSGQCGRLKCCLNYELDTYLDALKDFPKKADKLKTAKGTASLIKSDIFKGLLYYSYDDPSLRGPMVAITKERVKEILDMNAKGEQPNDFISYEDKLNVDLDKEIEFADVTGEIELPKTKKRRKKRNSGKRKRGRNNKRNRGKNAKSKEQMGKSSSGKRNMKRGKKSSSKKKKSGGNDQNNK